MVNIFAKLFDKQCITLFMLKQIMDCFLLVMTSLYQPGNVIR